MVTLKPFKLNKWREYKWKNIQIIRIQNQKNLIQ